MEKDVARLHQLLREGNCCASALVKLGLELKDDENPQLVQAASGLCFGVQGQLLCGALTGAACMLNILAPGAANSEMVPELAAWFQAEYGDRYGGSDCAVILDGDPMNKAHRCPGVIEATYRKARSILADYGYDFNGVISAAD